MERDPLGVAIAKLPSLSRGQQLVVRFMLSDPAHLIFMSSMEVAQRVGVSDATVIRTCQALGYEGYAAFKHELIDSLQQNNENPADRLLKHVQHPDGSNDYAVLFQQDTHNLNETIRSMDIEMMEEVTESMLGCRKIFVLGLNSCATLAQFLFFHLRRMGAEVELINSGGVTMMEHLGLARAGDALIAVSFPRYSTDSLTAVRFARETDMKIISLTNSLDNQIARASDYALIARSDNPVSFMNSFVGAMCVCNLLLLRYGFKVREQVIESLTRLEKVRAKHNIYIDKKQYSSF